MPETLTVRPAPCGCISAAPLLAVELVLDTWPVMVAPAGEVGVGAGAGAGVGADAGALAPFSADGAVGDPDWLHAPPNAARVNSTRTDSD
ncbi:MAG: hypothetical protein KGN76_08445 [Acidobacteriota bacterium]|nr:hypothetical protein [Acidobacteriota bacterium]